MKKEKKKIKEYLNQSESTFKLNKDYGPKYFGKGKVVAYEFLGFENSFCQCSKWVNGEGFDFSFITKDKTQNISLHMNEVEIMLLCLNKLKFFYD